MAARIPAGTPWAHLQADDVPFPCKDFKVLTWDADDNKIAATEEYERVFRETLAESGFQVSGDPTNLFEEDQKSTDIQVGALMTGIAVTACSTQGMRDLIAGAARKVKGTASMQLEWQIYSTVRAKVLARIPTSGSGEEKKGTDSGFEVLLHRAFAANVRELIASDAFRQAVASPSPQATSAAPPDTPITFRRPPAATSMPLNVAAKGVVSIFAGAGMGSGVLISSDGYILTNHHVAGEAGRVRVRWSDGTDTPGEVIRSDRRRDVTLIKTPPKAQPLAIRAGAAQLGETVFAIGTPLDRELAGTLTRGVVSSTRTRDGLTFIQSDVGVTHGNSGGPLLDEKGAVIGLTVSGLYPEESKSLNLFIPIHDALRALNLQPAP
ncbi:MAG: trypsin-like peptidase domain-containing protein [Phenylobacterium sp.]